MVPCPDAEAACTAIAAADSSFDIILAEVLLLYIGNTNGLPALRLQRGAARMYGDPDV